MVADAPPVAPVAAPPVVAVPPVPCASARPALPRRSGARQQGNPVSGLRHVLKLLVFPRSWNQRCAAAVCSGKRSGDKLQASRKFRCSNCPNVRCATVGARRVRRLHPQPFRRNVRCC